MPSDLKPGITRRQIYWVNIPESQARGREQFNRRPWLIVSADVVQKRVPLVVAVPLTSQVHQEQGYRQARIRIPASEVTVLKPGALEEIDRLALTEQVRALSQQRLEGDAVGLVSVKIMNYVSAGLSYVLGLP